MNSEQFDALSRSLARSNSRRSALRFLAATTLGVVAGLFGVGEQQAKGQSLGTNSSGDGLAGGALGAAPCGRFNYDDCCPGEICGAGLTCQYHKCLPCGSEREACCPGRTCKPGHVCQANGTCIGSCGHTGQPCCDGARCEPMAICDAKTSTCIQCGANQGQPCCAGGQCAGIGSACVEGICRAVCGNLGQACCTSGPLVCVNQFLNCVGGVCVSSGLPG